MAVKDSDLIANGSGYALGDYSFRIERSSVPGSTNDKIEAICTDKDGHNSRKSIQIPSRANIEGWYVEANETEATVYIKTTKDSGGGGDLIYSDPIGAFWKDTSGAYLYTVVSVETEGTAYAVSLSTKTGGSGIGALCVFCNRPAVGSYTTKSGGIITFRITGQNGGYASLGPQWVDYYDDFWISSPAKNYDVSAKQAYDILYNSPPEIKDSYMVGRFAIELEDAGGVGPGSDWIDPGDYDPDWEPEDPTHTLYVTVTGALSGRHNDPIEDPSYSYIPSDKDTVKDYGCGGDGGHGGGGGAGASTVVVYKFATNQANSKEVTAIARRHGYGSGGGKGGKGGDGCILVYY